MIIFFLASSTCSLSVHLKSYFLFQNDRRLMNSKQTQRNNVCPCVQANKPCTSIGSKRLADIWQGSKEEFSLSHVSKYKAQCTQNHQCVQGKQTINKHLDCWNIVFATDQKGWNYAPMKNCGNRKSSLFLLFFF